MKYLSTFTGVGGFELGFPKEWECVGFSEKDKYCSELLEKKYPNIKNYGDITKINPKDLPDFDLLCGGFPCQDVSLAGKRDLTKGRSMLINDVFRIIKEKQPKYIVLENVKGLLSMKDFWDSIRWTLKNLGYGVLYKVLNSKDYGVPQNRERIFIVCKKGGWDFMEFQYPDKLKKVYLKEILEKDVDKKYYLSKIQVNKLYKNIEEKNRFGSCNTLNDLNGYSFCLSSSMGIGGGYVPKIIDPKTKRIHKESPTLRSGIGSGNKFIVHSLHPRSGNPKQGGTGHLSKEGNESYTVDTGNMQCLETYPTITGELSHSVGRYFTAEKFKQITGELRRLTPIECERLQGFPDSWTEGFSDTQRYKMMGNAVTVNVTKAILKNINIQMRGSE